MRLKININENEKKVAYLMLLSLFVDQWNVFIVPMENGFIKNTFISNNLVFGLATAAIIGGAAVGSLMGGILSDRLGRKNIFSINMIIFIVAAIGSAVSTIPAMFIVFRLTAGVAVGSDLANCYCFIMESIPPGEREVLGAKNTLMATGAILSINFLIMFLILGHLTYGNIWRIVMLLSVFPALFALIFSFSLKESEIWSYRKRMFGKEDGIFHFLRELRKDPVRWRTSKFSWISGIASSVEVGTFAFFIPLIISNLNIAGLINQRLLIISVYSFGLPAGILGPKLLPRIGLKNLSVYGYSITIISLFGSGLFIVLKDFIIVPLFMILFVFGNHWNNQPILDSQSLISSPEYRGSATGFSNFIAEFPAFLSISVFPYAAGKIGLGYSTLVLVLAPIVGLAVSIRVFEEIYGYRGDNPSTKNTAFNEGDV
ncbi:MAG: MFS transporter [Cuniculiplasma sp.]